MIRLAILLCLLPLSAVRAEEVARDHLVLVRVAEGNGVTSGGSGVCIWSNKQRSLFATCAHVISSQRITVDGAQAWLVEIDQKNDVAILEAHGWYNPIPMRAEPPRIGQMISSEGYPSMRLARRIGPMIGRIGQSYEARFVSLPGHSGGPAYVDRQLVGLVWGGPENYRHAAIVPVSRIRPLFKRFLARELRYNPELQLIR